VDFRNNHRQTLVEIRSFDRNTFRQTFSRFGHVIRSYFGYAYKIRHQIECRLLYCIKFYIISVSIPFGKHSANIQPFRSCESVKVQLGLKFGKEIKQIDRLILLLVTLHAIQHLFRYQNISVM